MKENNNIKSIERVKERRLALGLSYQRLSGRTGISRSTLHRYESGTIKNLPADKLSILASALETTPSYIMGWDNVETSTDVDLKYEMAKEALLKLFKKHKSLFNHIDISVDKLSEDELENLTEDIVYQIKLVSYKYKKE